MREKKGKMVDVRGFLQILFTLTAGLGVTPAGRKKNFLTQWKRTRGGCVLGGLTDDGGR